MIPLTLEASGELGFESQRSLKDGASNYKTFLDVFEPLNNNLSFTLYLEYEHELEEYKQIYSKQGIDYKFNDFFSVNSNIFYKKELKTKGFDDVGLQMGILFKLW
jgi:hypothetical protein